MKKQPLLFFGNMTPPTPTFDGPYVDSRLNTPISSIGFSTRTKNVLLYDYINGYINLLGDLIQKSESELLRMPNSGRKTTEEVKTYLAGEGLSLAPYGKEDQVKPALKESSEEASKPQTPAPLPAIETHDEFSTIADQLLPAGAVGYIPLPKKADAIVRAAKEVFMTSEGNHHEGDNIAADYSFAIKRLPPQETAQGKTYPIYLSDAALKVLSQPEALKQFHAALKTETAKSAAIG